MVSSKLKMEIEIEVDYWFLYMWNVRLNPFKALFNLNDTKFLSKHNKIRRLIKISQLLSGYFYQLNNWTRGGSRKIPIK